MTNAEKKLYLKAVSELRFKYMCSHPDEMCALDIFVLRMHLFTLKCALRFIRSNKGNRWITNFAFWRS